MIGLDPGPEESALVTLSGTKIKRAVISPNQVMLDYLRFNTSDAVLVIEKIASYGMPVGESVLETAFWSGRFFEVYRGPIKRMHRKELVTTLCGDSRAGDKNVRQALIDIYGGTRGKDAAIGTKKKPGPLYNIKTHLWSALALAVAYRDLPANAPKTVDISSADDLFV